MRFARPDILWAMALVMPLLIGFLWWTWRERQKLITQFIQARLLPTLTVGVSKPRQKLRLILLSSAVALTLIALSRPQWGFGYQEVKQRGLDIVIGIDTSRSMLAEDVSPNRLQKAKLAAQDLRQLAKSDRMGLVAFAGSAFLQMPMSLDENAFRQHLEALDTRLLPQGGTALAEAIQTARTAFKEAGEENHRALVLFTDGEDHDGQAIEAAAQAAKEGLVVFTIGLGSPNGELIPVRDAKGRVDFIKDENGNAVKSRLNESLLQDIAKAGKGFYLHLAGAGGMEMLYERGLAPLPKRDLQATMMRRYFERFQWFLAAACLLLIAELFILDFKPPARRREPAATPPTPASAPLATSATMGILLLCAMSAHASPSNARRDYEAGRFKDALSEYESLLEKKPKDAALRYNAGAAAFQAGKLEDAAEHFGSALATQDPQLQQRAYYNLGNTQFRLGEDAGEPDKTQKMWEQSIQSYETALKLNPQDDDAQHNLRWVKQRLEELKKQQQQQQQQQDSDSKDKDDQKKDDQEKNQDQKDKNSKNDQNQDQKQDQNQEKSSPEKKDQDQAKQDSSPEEESAQKDKQESQKQESNQEDQKAGQEDQKSAQDERDKKDGAQPKPGQRGMTNNPSATQPEGGNPMSGQPLQMTQREAIRLLEALRSEEKLFLPPPPQKPRKNQRQLKDW